jgi:hypothetical protein
MSNEERTSILQQHNSIYNGYATLQPKGNLTPLTVGNYAQDEGGITVNNKGEVTTYKNYKINESDYKLDIHKAEKNVEVTEIEDDDVNYSEEDPAFDYMSGGPEQFSPTPSDLDPYDEDLQAIQNMFDYEDVMGNGDTGNDMMALQKKMDSEFSGKEDLSGEDSAYNFVSHGGNVDSYGDMNEGKGMCQECGMNEEVCECGMWESVDEDLVESIKKEKERITEMFKRFSNFN